MTIHIDSELTLLEQSELEQNEATIERGLKTFYEVGNAFIVIRDKRLYRNDYSTFEEYCQERWEISRQHAYHLIDAANVATYFVNHGLQIPENERQARALKHFPEEMRPVILSISNSYSKAIGAKNTSGIIERTGRNLIEASITGHVDTGNGFSTPFIASLSRDDEEAAKRSAQYAAEKYNKADFATSSKDIEYYTPLEYLDAARRVMGSIDLDPSSCREANKQVQASQFYDKQNDGLSQKWYGNVWLNPPYGALSAEFGGRLIDEYKHGNVKQAITLFNAHITDTRWFTPYWDYLICFTNHRIDFLNAEDKTASTHGSLFVYLGKNHDAFIREFKPFGVVVKRVDQ